MRGTGPREWGTRVRVGSGEDDAEDCSEDLAYPVSRCKVIHLSMD